MTAASVLESVFDDDEFDLLLVESERAAATAHALDLKVLAAEAELDVGLVPFADLGSLRASSAEARRQADELQQKLGAAASAVAARVPAPVAGRAPVPQMPRSRRHVPFELGAALRPLAPVTLAVFTAAAVAGAAWLHAPAGHG